jgi:hypothetical protein
MTRTLPLLLALAAVAAAPVIAAPRGDGAELLKEAVLSLHASSVYPPAPEKLAKAGIKALQAKSPCLDVARKKGGLRLSCNSRSVQLAWPPTDGKAVVAALQEALHVTDSKGRVELVRAQWVVRAVADSLRDPYTAYLDPATVAKLDTSRRSALATPGIELSPRDKQRVRETRPGSDAAKQGLKEGDQIVAVDNTPAHKLNYVELNAALTGPTGTTVRIDYKPALPGGKLGPTRTIILARLLVPEPLVNS